MKRLSTFIVFFFAALLFNTLAYSFDNITTHSQITRGALTYCGERGYYTFLNDSAVNQITIGAVLEDDPATRTRAHFSPSLGVFPDAISWAFGDTITPWNLGINQYTWPNSFMASTAGARLLSLGHVMHLLQDMAVPAHVRKDPHLPPLNDDPFEVWAKSHSLPSIVWTSSEDWIASLETDSTAKARDYFSKLSWYTRNNYFSVDTCFDYTNGGPEKCGEDDDYFYGWNFIASDQCNRKIAHKGISYRYFAAINTLSEDATNRESTIDEVIAEEQFNELAPTAILFSASLAKSYFDEAGVLATARVSTHHIGDLYYASPALFLPTGAAISVTVTGPGISGEAIMVYEPSLASWILPSAPAIGTTQLWPASYQFTVNAAAVSTLTAQVTGYVANFATNLQPTGTAVGPITFSWTGVSFAESYDIELYDNDPWVGGGTLIWKTNPSVRSTTGISYNGPALASGHTYYYAIMANVPIKGIVNTSVAFGQFTYREPTYVVTGLATFNGSGLAGVTVTIAGATSGSMTTDINGRYLFHVPNGTYAITAALTGYTLTPPSTTITVNNGNIVQNFLASPLSLNDGLVAHYPFNGNANDASGNRNNGTVSGATSTHDRFGIPDRAYALDGVDDFISFPETVFGPSVEGFTFSTWVMTEDYTFSGGQTIIYKGSINGEASLERWNNNSFSFGIKLANATWYWLPAVPMAESTWVYLTGVYRKGQALELWMNGELKTSMTIPSYNLFNADQYHRSSIGAYTRSSRFWRGSVDEVRIYNRALSPTEIQSLFEQSSVSHPISAGNPMISRAYIDTAEGVNFIDLTSAISGSGWLNSWSFYSPASSSRQVELYIFRQTIDGGYDLIGKSGLVSPYRSGVNSFSLPNIAVQTGDRLGWYYPRGQGGGVIPFDHPGNTVLWHWPHDTDTELSGHVPSGHFTPYYVPAENSRTYSIQVGGFSTSTP